MDCVVEFVEAVDWKVEKDVSTAVVAVEDAEVPWVGGVSTTVRIFRSEGEYGSSSMTTSSSSSCSICVVIFGGFIIPP